MSVSGSFAAQSSQQTKFGINDTEKLSPFGSHTQTNEELSINELTIKYKTKRDQESNILFDNKSGSFCHIICDMLSNDNAYDYIIPRRVIFVIDKSGSMQGLKWINTVSTTINALKQLRQGYDRFNVILFDHDIDILFQQE